MRLRPLILTALAVFLPSLHLCVAWEVYIGIQNQNSSGSYLASSMVIGEHQNALEGYDASYDHSYTFPSMSNRYVQPYIVHNDWGAHNGNFLADIRSQVPGNKTWNCKARAQNPHSAFYTLSWTVPADFPAYYQATLTILSVSIDMRAQNQYTYATYNAYTDFSIAVQFDDSIPYQIREFPTLSFSDNQIQSLNLNEYFSSGDSGLDFACIPNANLVQELDNMLWQIYPNPGWIGETSAEIRVYGSQGDSLSAFVNVVRDDTNSPPQWEGALELQLIQNQQIILSWEEQIYDADRDEITVNIDGGDHFRVFLNDLLDEATLIPEPAFKGETVVHLLLSDGFRSLQRFDISVQVLPSEPRRPEALELQVLPDHSLMLSWAEVNADISGLPINQIRYRISLYSQPDATGLISEQESSDTNIILPLSQERVFIRVIAINEVDEDDAREY
ncbi:MAG: hypothetical protein LHW64_00695 [Candidatus Cloacimonetes bacterium]|nr:hypothetical protein [Candidatus Cloacimonadota bacterium]MDY0228627.1 hypothetical protein [Candidatus Cloacimonadaceae bacterium]